MNLGEKIHHLRQARHWTQQQLAAKVGSSQGVISRLEDGGLENPQMKSLKALALALGCTMDYLAGMHEAGERSPD